MPQNNAVSSDLMHRESFLQGGGTGGRRDGLGCFEVVVTFFVHAWVYVCTNTCVPTAACVSAGRHLLVCTRM